MVWSKALSALLLSTIASKVHAQCDDSYAECQMRQVFDVSNLDEYYASTAGLSGDDLKLKLNSIIKGHKYYSYGCVWTALAEADADTDENNPDHIIGIYTRKSIARLDRVCSGNNHPDAWNREHVWAKSHGFPNKSQHGYTDIHHLVAADQSVNFDRSNFDFMPGGVQNDDCKDCNVSEGTFEPPDIVKGQIARIMFYMTTRYMGNDMDSTKMPKLTLLNRATERGYPEFGYLSHLLQWHCNFPVSDRERRRNDIVQTWQGNRNPFIDRPEFAESIWSEFDWEKCEGSHIVPEPEPTPGLVPAPSEPSEPTSPPSNSPGGSAPKPTSGVWINEIHYDDEGQDDNEFVEIACQTTIDLTGYKVILYNGKNGAKYNTAQLSGTCSPTGNFIAEFYPSSSGIQNGDMDGVALVDKDENVLEFISYEGIMTASDGPAAGMVSSDIGISENSSTSEGTSLQLKGTGCVNTDFTWTIGPASANAVNEGQEIRCEEKNMSNGEL